MYAQLLSTVAQPGCLTSIVVTAKMKFKHEKIKKKTKLALMN